jgi:EAL domain-containing protein (putative c-di-GMP-specific phosphodiesterase class I)
VGAPDGPSTNGIGRMLDLVRLHLDMDVAFVSEFVGEDWVLRYISPEGTRVKPGYRHPLEDTYCKRITDGRLDHVIPDAAADPALAALAITDSLSIGAYVGVPIVLSDGSLYGSFCSFRRTPDPTLTPRDARFLSLVASLLSERLEADRAVQGRQAVELARVQAVLSDAGSPRIVYQPIVDLGSRTVWALEALSRFDAAPDRPVEEWFAEAHRVGLGVSLELKALAAAVADLPRLGEATLTVNLGPDALCSPDLGGVLDGVPPARLVLEVTEDELMGDVGRTRAAVERLRTAGFRLAVDDIGAGYAGLAKIVNLAPEIIKLDRALVARIDEDVTRQALVRAGVGFAAALGAALVAEGIETEEELRTLLALGITLGQGFHLGRPEPAEYWARSGT